MKVGERVKIASDAPFHGGCHGKISFFGEGDNKDLVVLEGDPRSNDMTYTLFAVRKKYIITLK